MDKFLSSLIYLENMRLPTEKAHGIQIMKMCEAFSKTGINVTLAVPSFNKSAHGAFDYYGVPKIFPIQNRYWAPNFHFLNAFNFILRTFIFFLSFLFSQDWKGADAVYTRDTNIAFLLAFFRIPFIWEMHQDFHSLRAVYAIKKSIAVIFITSGLKEKFVSRGFMKNKLYVFPDAVDLERIVAVKNKDELRKSLSLPAGFPIVLYSGHLYEWKGAHVFAQAAQFARSDAVFVFVGGTKEDAEFFRAKYGQNPRIKILGHKPYSEMPKYEQSADILVIPNSGRFDISKFYTSPMKLFSAMASGLPIIASDLPSLREVVDEKMVFFVQPDDPEKLARMIDYVIGHPEEAKIKALSALAESKKYTWDARARGIKAALESHL